LSLTKTYILQNVKGFSLEQNSNIVNELITSNKWETQFTNHQLEIVEIPHSKTFAGYNQQIIIFYNENDLLINCISFAKGKEPNPFKYYSNKKVLKKFSKDFQYLISKYLEGKATI